jgi:hypothetical protein
MMMNEDYEVKESKDFVVVVVEFLILHANEADDAIVQRLIVKYRADNPPNPKKYVQPH